MVDVLIPLGHYPQLRLLAMLEVLGRKWPVYNCLYCRKLTSHAQKAVGRNTWAICTVCGEASRVVAEER
jgi:hypothetical protein